MTVLESDAYQGLEADNVRPGARVQHGQSFQTLSEDQAFLYRSIIAQSVPNAPGVSVATPHVHDGTTGAIIPIPLATGSHHITMAAVPPDTSGVPPTVSSPTGTVHDWARMVFVPFYVPAGVTSVRVLISCSRAAVDDIRVRTYDQLLAENAGAFLSPRPFRMPQQSEAEELGLDSLPQNRVYPYADLNVTAGEFNVLLIEGWDGCFKRGSDEELVNPGREFFDYVIFPEWAPPNDAPQYTLATEADGGVKIPTSSQHIAAYPFTSINSEMLADDFPLSTYLAHAVTLNDGLLQELLTGLPVAGLDTLVHGGHNHKDDAGSSDPREGGAVIDQPLGSWFFGVGRSPPSGSAGQMTFDEVNATWAGRFYAPTLLGTAPTGSDIELGKFLFRMPKAKAVTFSTAASDVRVAYLASNNTGGNVTMRATVQDSDGTGGTVRNSVITNDATVGVAQLIVSSNVVCSAGDVELKQVLVAADQDNAKTKGFCVHGMALGIVA